MIYIGCDPGKSGSVAFLPEKGEPWCIKNSETLSDICEELQVVASDNRVFAMLETVHSMPGQGVASSFKFGQSFGNLEAALTALRIPFERVRPLAWQKAMQCKTGGNKNVSKAKAQELFPTIKITHANADALLLAEYARRNSGL